MASNNQSQVNGCYQVGDEKEGLCGEERNGWHESGRFVKMHERHSTSWDGGRMSKRVCSRNTVQVRKSAYEGAREVWQGSEGYTGGATAKGLGIGCVGRSDLPQ